MCCVAVWLKTYAGGFDPCCGLGLNERAALKILSKKKRWDNSERNKGWERSVWTECSSLLALIAPHCPSVLSPHNSSSATRVSPCRHALQTEHLSWAVQRAWLSFAEGIAAPVCLCPLTHRDMAAAPFPLLSSGGPGGLSHVSCHAPPKIPWHRPQLLLPALINGSLIEPPFSYPSFCKFKSCSPVLLTCCWPTSWLPLPASSPLPSSIKGTCPRQLPYFLEQRLPERQLWCTQVSAFPVCFSACPGSFLLNFFFLFGFLFLYLG